MLHKRHVAPIEPLILPGFVWFVSDWFHIAHRYFFYKEAVDSRFYYSWHRLFSWWKITLEL